MDCMGSWDEAQGLPQLRMARATLHLLVLLRSLLAACIPCTHLVICRVLDTLRCPEGHHWHQIPELSPRTPITTRNWVQLPPRQCILWLAIPSYVPMFVFVRGIHQRHSLLFLSSLPLLHPNEFLRQNKRCFDPIIRRWVHLHVYFCIFTRYSHFSPTKRETTHA